MSSVWTCRVGDVFLKTLRVHPGNMVRARGQESGPSCFDELYPILFT